MYRFFKELQKELNLKRFLGSELGTLYFVPHSSGKEDVIVRHFDQKLQPQMIRSYSDIVNSVSNWVDENQSLNKIVRVEKIKEFGHDYTLRQHYVYYVSLVDYYDQEQSIPIPEQLSHMQSILNQELNQKGDEGHKLNIIKKVLKNSLHKKKKKTFFDGKEDKFIVVEPKILVEDVIDWQK